MTLTDLYRKTLEKLHVIAAGEDVEPEDQIFVQDKYAAVYDMLRVKDLVAWSSSDDVPDYAVIPLTNMLAWACASEFGMDSNQFAQEGGLDLPVTSFAERQLRTQLARAYVPSIAQSEYF